MGLGIVLTKKWRRPAGVTAMGMAGWQLTAGGLILLAPTMVIDGVPPGIDLAAVLGYAWLAIPGALIAYSLWFAGITRPPVAPTALLGLLSPLVAAVLGALVASEVLAPLQLIGFALAMAAMVCGQLVKSPPAAAPSPQAAQVTAIA